jgi:hypothetical protein
MMARTNLVENLDKCGKMTRALDVDVRDFVGGTPRWMVLRYATMEDGFAVSAAVPHFQQSSHS